MDTLPKGWAEKSLGSICDIARGGSPRPIKSYLTNDPNGINWIKIGDATASNKYIYHTEEKIKPSGASRSRIVNEGDFILSNSMSFGRPYIMKTTGCIHDGWLVLSDKHEVFYQDYLYQFLSSPEAYYQFDSKASGSTVRNLNIDIVKSVTVKIPPLKEQKRIAAKLDNLFGRSRAAREELTPISRLIERYKQAVLSVAFSGGYTQKWGVSAKEKWKKQKLEDCGVWAGGGTPSKSNASFWTKGNIPWVSPKDMKIFHIEKSEDYITKSAVENSPAKILPIGTVLMVTRSGILKHSFPVAVTKVEAAINQDLKAIAPHKNIDPEFLAYCLMSHEREILDACCKDGTTVDSISTDQLKDFEVFIPKEKEDQIKIVRHIEKAFATIDAITAQAAAGLHQLSRLEAQCLNKAFRGELVSQDPNDEPASALLERIRAESVSAKLKRKGKKAKD
jgi:type I restriction enzyme, S subunit